MMQQLRMGPDLQATRRTGPRLPKEFAAWSDVFPTEQELRLLVGQFETFAGQIRGGLEEADFQTKRKLLRLLIQRIAVDEDEIRIVYKVQLPPFVPRPASRGVLQDCLQFRETPTA